MSPQPQPTLDDILKQLKTLTAQVERMVEARDKAATVSAPPPAAAAPPPASKEPGEWKLAGVADPAAGQTHDFTVPRGSASDSFNSATPAKATALPNYYDEPKAEELIDVPSTLAALALQNVSQKNRQAIYPVEIEQYMIELPKSREDREAVDIVMGKSRMGFGIVALMAAGGDGKAASLFVLDDQLRSKMFIAGPEKIPADLEKKLAENGVVYMPRSDEKVAGSLNDFLAEGAKYRGERGLLSVGSTQRVIESLLQAFGQVYQMPPRILDKGQTLGSLLTSTPPVPDVFTSIMRPRA